MTREIVLEILLEVLERDGMIHGAMQNALKGLLEEALYVKVLGNY